MSLASLPLVAMVVGLAAYAVLGGADFGAGFWQLAAGRGERAEAVRGHAQHAIAPVWEANHVWLIFVITVCWTAYPVAFASIASTLAVPLFAAAVGIILRGSSYALREVAWRPAEHRLAVAVFALSSLLTPFALGTAVGAIATLRVPVGNARGGAFSSWLAPAPLCVGLLAVITAAFLAAIFLTADAARTAPDLVDAFRRRALVSGVVAGLAAAGGLIVVRRESEPLWAGLSGGLAAAAIGVSAFGGLTTLGLVVRRRYGLARVSAAVAVAGVVAGWPLAQRPRFLPGLTIAQAAAPRATLVGLVLAIGFGALLLFPSLALLFQLVLRGAFDQPGPLAQPAGSRPIRPSTRHGSAITCLVAAGLGAVLIVVATNPWLTATGLVALAIAALTAFTRIGADLCRSVGVGADDPSG